MTYSQRTGFNAAAVFGWIRSEAGENYRPTRTPGLTFDPWYGSDPTYSTAWAGAPVAVAW